MNDTIKKQIDTYFEALCDETFTDWTQFDTLLSQLTGTEKEYFLQKWKDTYPIRQAVELLKEGGYEKLDQELKKRFSVSS